MNRPRLNAASLIFVTLAFITLLNNTKLWFLLSQRIPFYSVNAALYFLSIALLIIVILSFITLALGHGRLLKPVLITLTLLSGFLSYFTNKLGVVFDPEMIRNVFDTIKEANIAEAQDLGSASLFLHLLIYSGLPIGFTLWAKIRPQRWHKTLLSKAMLLIGLVIITGILLSINFKYVSYFSRENRDLRLYITPVYALNSAHKLINNMTADRDQAFKLIDGSRSMTATVPSANNNTGMAALRKPIVGIFLLGETARSDHFSLNAYPRSTNPYLDQQSNLVSFNNARSCGTSTAFSVPCMFSFLNRGDYSPEKARLQSNSLDLLKDAGVNVIWVENNSSCKKVCERFEDDNVITLNMSHDQILLDTLDDLLQNAQQDTLIVMHMMGSHGPSYYKRYPDNMEKFNPACKSSAPQNCSLPEITNAYDNSIVYTDWIIHQSILRLKQNEETQPFMIYASDHGESLGEKGVYLHGLPYRFAPKAQTQVPIILWLSEAFQKDLPISITQIQKNRAISHDFLSHTLIGAYKVQSPVYQASLDLLKPSPVKAL